MRPGRGRVRKRKVGASHEIHVKSETTGDATRRGRQGHVCRRMTDSKHMFAVWRLANQLVWPGCRCRHVSLIRNRMTGNINYSNLAVITVTRILTAKPLVLNCMSHLINVCSNSLSHSVSLWKSNILITKGHQCMLLIRG